MLRSHKSRVLGTLAVAILLVSGFWTPAEGTASAEKSFRELVKEWEASASQPLNDRAQLEQQLEEAEATIDDLGKESEEARAKADEAQKAMDARDQQLEVAQRQLADLKDEVALEEENRKVMLFVERYSYCEVAFAADDYDPFFNVNTPDDLVRAETLLREAAA